MLKEATNIYKYKTQGFQKVWCDSSLFLYGFVDLEKTKIVKPTGPTFFSCVIDYNLVQIFF
jgi:hypothetical protein